MAGEVWVPPATSTHTRTHNGKDPHPMPKYKLSEFIERRNRDVGVEIDLDDGTSILIPAPELWSDSVMEALKNGDVDAALVGLLGEEQAERWTAQGGTWRLLNAIYVDSQGVTPGESSASSDS